MSTTERKTRLKHLALWTWSWVLTLAIATFGPIFIWNSNTTITLIAILINLINGILMIISNRKLFNDYDELEKKIYLESLGLTLGLTVIVGMTYSLLHQTHIINSNVEISPLIMFIGITNLITLNINKRRYS